MGYQTDSNGRLGLPSELYQYRLLTDGTALSFMFTKIKQIVGLCVGGSKQKSVLYMP